LVLGIRSRGRSHRSRGFSPNRVQTYKCQESIRHCSELGICCWNVLRCLHFITGVGTL